MNIFCGQDYSHPSGCSDRHCYSSVRTTKWFILHQGQGTDLLSLHTRLRGVMEKDEDICNDDSHSLYFLQNLNVDLSSADAFLLLLCYLRISCKDRIGKRII